MPVTVVVGGQFGSEGKGKICAHLAVTDNVDYMVRCGGPNSGHTVYANGQRYQLQQVPAGFVNPDIRLLIAPGALVDPAVFLRETAICGLDPDRIGIDRNAVSLMRWIWTTRCRWTCRAAWGRQGPALGRQ